MQRIALLRFITSPIEIYHISNKNFHIIFPQLGQDIEFSEDVLERMGAKAFEKFQAQLWENPVLRSEVKGIDGTLFYNLINRKKYFPTKRFSEAIIPFDKL